MPKSVQGWAPQNQSEISLGSSLVSNWPQIDLKTKISFEHHKHCFFQVRDDAKKMSTLSKVLGILRIEENMLKTRAPARAGDDDDDEDDSQTLDSQNLNAGSLSAEKKKQKHDLESLVKSCEDLCDGLVPWATIIN